MATDTTRVRLDLFSSAQFDRGRGLLVEAAWYLCKILVFLTAFPWPSCFKCAVLRMFGAEIGNGVVIKPRVNIHLPWKLRIGDHSWIGEEVFILNLERVTIGTHACISQRAFICTGNHDFRDPAFPYMSKAIVISDGAWIGAQVLVAPGTCIGIDTVVAANSRASGELAPGMIYDGTPARATKARWHSESQNFSP